MEIFRIIKGYLYLWLGIFVAIIACSVFEHADKFSHVLVPSIVMLVVGVFLVMWHMASNVGRR